MTHAILLLLCAVAIYFSCSWFVNAVEWLGRRLNMGSLAMGTVLAAVGTALPESTVTFVAVVFGHGPSDQDIGVGAAMGGPLALATVAYGVVGWTLLASRRRNREQCGDPERLVRDQTWFLVVFAANVALGLLAFAWKPVLGLGLFAVYAVYFCRQIRQQDTEPQPEPPTLKLQARRRQPATWAILLQTCASLIIIFGASQLFVDQLDAIGPLLGLPAAATALLLSPLATELPEIMNAVIWVRQGKAQLALANVSGAMMIQATVPSGLGILFTPWQFDTPLLISGVATLVAVCYLLVTARSGRLTIGRLSVTAAFYGVFALALVPGLLQRL